MVPLALYEHMLFVAYCTRSMLLQNILNIQKTEEKCIIIFPFFIFIVEFANGFLNQV